MAMTKQAFALECAWIDREGTKVATTSYIESAATGVNAMAKAATLVPLIKALSSCHLAGYRLLGRYADNAVTGAGEAEKKGVFFLGTATGTQFRTQIPGFKDGLLDVNGRDIIVKGGSITTEVNAFLDLMLNGAAGIANGAVNQAGLDVDHAVRAYKYHVRSLSRGRRRNA
jgi:hypothetical protein